MWTAFGERPGLSDSPSPFRRPMPGEPDGEGLARARSPGRGVDRPHVDRPHRSARTPDDFVGRPDALGSAPLPRRSGSQAVGGLRRLSRPWRRSRQVRIPTHSGAGGASISPAAGVPPLEPKVAVLHFDRPDTGGRRRKVVGTPAPTPRRDHPRPSVRGPVRNGILLFLFAAATIACTWKGLAPSCWPPGELWIRNLSTAPRLSPGGREATELTNAVFEVSRMRVVAASFTRTVPFVEFPPLPGRRQDDERVYYRPTGRGDMAGGMLWREFELRRAHR